MSQPVQEDHDTRPQIKIEDGELPALIDKAIAALVSTKKLFVFGDRLCLIHVTEEDEVGIIARPAGAARVHYPDSTLLTEMLTGAAKWLRFDKRIGGYRDANAPRRIADHILARNVFPEFPRLSGVIECPTIWRGELVDRPGHHEASGLYLTARPKGYKSPSREFANISIEVARERLFDAVSTFEFETEADRVAAVAGIMTAVLRRPMTAAPAIAIDAPLPGSGKSLLARLMSEIAIGRQGSVIALTGEKPEDEKRLGAALLAGDQVVIGDNIESEIDAPLLCSMLTESEVSVRVLGQSMNVRLPTNVVIILNGNNLAVVRDLRRRVLMMRMNANCERPEERSFARDAIAYVRERRGSLINAVLTLALAYRAAGEPHVGSRPFGGFDDWDRTVRKPLLWLGLADPLDPSNSLREIDPDIQTTRAMFSAWHDAFAPDGATCADALRTARKHNGRFDGDEEPAHPDLRDAIQMAVGDRLDSRVLSRWLRRHRDRIVDGLTLRQETDRHLKVARWQVVECGVKRG